MLKFKKFGFIVDEGRRSKSKLQLMFKNIPGRELTSGVKPLEPLKGRTRQVKSSKGEFLVNWCVVILEKMFDFK